MEHLQKMCCEEYRYYVDYLMGSAGLSLILELLTASEDHYSLEFSATPYLLPFKHMGPDRWYENARFMSLDVPAVLPTMLR